MLQFSTLLIRPHLLQGEQPFFSVLINFVKIINIPLNNLNLQNTHDTMVFKIAIYCLQRVEDFETEAEFEIFPLEDLLPNRQTIKKLQLIDQPCRNPGPDAGIKENIFFRLREITVFAANETDQIILRDFMNVFSKLIIIISSVYCTKTKRLTKVFKTFIFTR